MDVPRGPPEPMRRTAAGAPADGATPAAGAADRETPAAGAADDETTARGAADRESAAGGAAGDETPAGGAADAGTVTGGAADDETVHRLRLAAVPGLSPRLVVRLVRAFGTARRVLAASPAALARVPGVGAARSGLLAAAPSADEVRRDLARARAASAEVLVPGGPAWPAALDELPDPPSALWARGDLAAALRPGGGPLAEALADALGGRGVAIVGSRRATTYGTAQAGRLARELAALGVPVVSGLARGVDGAAHRGALSAGGRTVGVLGGGLARFYPAEHVPLAREMVAAGGAVVSEFPLDMPPLPHHFPRRNRILAALSAAVVVVEAAEGSGSLLTADHALDLGREVLAVPGRIDQPNSAGVHRLLREGAAVCESAADVLAALGLDPAAAGAAGAPAGGLPATADAAERALLGALAADDLDADLLLAATGLDPARGLAALSALELRGAVRLADDGRYSVVRTAGAAAP